MSRGIPHALSRRAAELGTVVWLDAGRLRTRALQPTPSSQAAEELASILHACEQAAVGVHAHNYTAARAAQLVPAFAPMPATTAVRSFRKATWTAVQSRTSSVDSTNCRHVVRVQGPFDPAHLQAAVASLWAAHPILNASAEEFDGSPWLVMTRRPPSFESHTPSRGAEQESAVRRLASNIVWRPFDLACEPLARAFVIQLGPHDYIVGFVVHHLITDTLSMRQMSRELLAHYAYHKGDAPRLPANGTLSYTDYLTCMNEWVMQPGVQDELNAWCARFIASGSVENLAPRPAASTSQGTREQFAVDEALTEALRALARRHQTTLFNILLAAHAWVSALIETRRQVTVGFIVFGRELPALQSVVGYLADRAYVHVSLEGDPSFEETLQRLQAATEETQRLQFLRSDFIQDALSEQGFRLTAPVLNFVPIAPARPRTASGALRFEDYPLEPAPGLSTVTPGVTSWLMLVESARTLEGHIRYPGPIHPLLRQTFLQTLRAVATDTRKRLSELERRRLTTAAPYETFSVTI